MNFVVCDGPHMWMGSNNYLTRIDTLTKTFIIYSTQNSGLPDSNVTSLAIDHNGNKWIGTHNGLAKFTGSTWTIYNTSNSAIPSDTIICIDVDHSGNIWVATHGRGIAKYNGSVWTNYNKNNSALPTDTIGALKADTVNNNVWVGTWGGGLVRISSSNVWSVFNTGNSPILLNDHITAIGFNLYNLVWIGSWGGANSFDGVSNWTTFRPMSNGWTTDYVTCLASSPTGGTWLGTTVGIIEARVGGGSYNNLFMGFIDDNVTALALDQGAQLWAGTKGNYLFAKQTSEFMEYFCRLPFTYINQLSLDESGTAWIATSGGIVRCDGTTWNIYNVDNISLGSNVMRSSACDLLGNKFIGSNLDGLYTKNGSGTWSADFAAAPFNSISTIAIDTNQGMWEGSNSGGLFDYGVTVYNTSNSAIPSNAVRNLAIDKLNRKWIASNVGIIMFDDINWNTYTTATTGLLSNDTYCVGIDTLGIIWAGGPGLAAYDGSSWTAYNSNVSGPNAIAVDKRNNNKWVGTLSGLVKYDNSVWTTYTTTNSKLPGNTVYTVGVDNCSNVWVGTNKGLALFNNKGVNFGPAPAFSFQTVGCNNQAQFTDQSTNGSTSWYWTFQSGSPASSNLQNPSTSFPTPGTYGVTLKTTNSYGSNTTYQSVVIPARPSYLDYTADSTMPIVCPAVVHFTNLSDTTKYNSYLWSFGDSTTSTAFNPTHTYTTSGTYYVQLQALNIVSGCTDTVQSPFYITVNCTVNTGIPEYTRNTFNIFPNPSTGIYSVLADGPFSYEVVDLVGNKLATGVSTNNLTKIDLQNMADGMYYLKINSDGNTTVKKLLKTTRN